MRADAAERGNRMGITCGPLITCGAMNGDLPLMDITRREMLAVAGALPFAGNALASDGAVPSVPAARALPDKSAFAATDTAYLDSGSQHPISLGGKAAVERRARS